MRLMTYNIKAGRYHPDGLNAIARLIEAYSPDVLGVQEVDENQPRTNFVAQTDWLTRRLRMRGLYAPAMQRDDGLYGVALLSRFPIQTHERRLLFRPAYPDADKRPRHDSEQRVALGAVIAYVERQTQGQTHRSAPTPDASVGANLRVRPFKVIVTHLGLTPDQRERQVTELAEFARTWHGDLPTMIMGDFNCDPDAPELAPLHAHFQEACAVSGVNGDARFTFPSGPLGARTDDGWRSAIDYVWATHDIRITSARVIIDETKASDHQPLVVEVEM
jgi:endonuclease/exonuclease/phosphatase family metal-dependent hydrolase